MQGERKDLTLVNGASLTQKTTNMLCCNLSINRLNLARSYFFPTAVHFIYPQLVMVL